MCGIFGYIKLRPHIDLSNAELLRGMGSILAHRGPDGFSIYENECFGVGIRRLAIVDPANGHQPHFSEDKRFGVALNGEIYNYREIRQKLSADGCIFHTGSDTEVLLHALCRLGVEETLNLINGMFAFVFFDTVTHKVVLVRDRLGVKPLYYSLHRRDYLLFASEWKAFYADPQFNPTIHDGVMGQVFRFGFPLEPKTVVKEVEAVLPAHAVFFSPAIEGQLKYWDIDFQSTNLNGAGSVKEMSREFGSLFDSALQLRIPSDSGYLSYLSAGLDSTAVAGTLSRRLNVDGLKTLCVGFDDAELDERAIARKNSEYFGTCHHDFEMVCLADDIESMLWHLEAPYSTLLFAPLYYLSKQTHALGYKVAINGDGSDELLGGYDYFKLLKIHQLLEEKPGKQRNLYLLKKIRGLTNTQLLSYKLFLDCQKMMNPKAAPNLPYGFLTVIPNDLLFEGGHRFFSHEELPVLFDPALLGQLSPLNQACYTERHFRLLNLTLPLNDKLSMAHSVETRSPFLDYRLWENFSFMPEHYRIFGLKEKYILRKSMEGIYPPWMKKIHKRPLNANPVKFLSAAWDKFEHLLTAEKTRSLEYFNPLSVNQARNEFIEYKKHGNAGTMTSFLFLVLVVHLFDEMFIQKKYQRTTVS